MAEIIRYSLSESQGIAEPGRAVAHLAAMPTAAELLGQKIKAEMERLRLSKKDVAEHFGIKQPSLTELLATGRLSKDRYCKLVTLNGRSLDWWFDIPAELVSASVPISAQAVRENPHPYRVVEPSDHTEAELLHLFQSLPVAEQDRLMAELRQKSEFYRSVVQEFMNRKHPGTPH